MAKEKPKTKTAEELLEQFKDFEAEMDKYVCPTCPHCGRCPHCGKPYNDYPYWPTYPYTPAPTYPRYPWYNEWTITC